MTFKMVELPYEKNALEPYISAQTFDFHYGKHYKTYVDNLNKLIENTEFSAMTLEEIIKNTYGKPEYAAIFNNAAQTWNHEFFWKSMRPNGGGEPKADLKQKIEASFGTVEKFREEFRNAAITQFGSGWAWLVEDGDKLKIIKTSNADTPIAHNYKPLLTIDVWEHAYYLDYQNKRADFVDEYIKNLLNW